MKPKKAKKIKPSKAEFLASLPENFKLNCNACLIAKMLSEFEKASLGKYGVRRRCKACDKEKYKGMSNDEREHRNTVAKEWRKNNPILAMAHTRTHYAKHKVERNRKRSEYRVKNIDRERERERNYTQNNRAKVAAKTRRREAAELRATPTWLTPIQNALIEEFYELAAARKVQTGIKYHVDHIVPLQAKGVNGLHVPWNLQLLTENENCSKQNRFNEGSI